MATFKWPAGIDGGFVSVNVMPADPFGVPLTRLDTLMPFSTEGLSLHRRHVAGTVTGGILSFKGNDGSSGWGRIPDSLLGTTTLTNDARIIVARNNTARKTNSGNNVIF